jgi:hypothetical protein
MVAHPSFLTSFLDCCLGFPNVGTAPFVYLKGCVIPADGTIRRTLALQTYQSQHHRKMDSVRMDAARGIVKRPLRKTTQSAALADP